MWPSRNVFVGRSRELSVLQANLAEAAGGHGSVVLLVGEPGIGKSRLAEEFAHQADAEVLVGRCYEGEGAPAFWPWTQILRAYSRARDASRLEAELGDTAPDVAAICPDLRIHLGRLPAPPLLAPEAARFRVFEGVATALTRAATVRPLVLILDDLQGADRPSLLLLQFLARALPEARILVIGSVRSRALEVGHPMAETLCELLRERAERITLAGLTQAEVGELLAEVGGEVPPALARAVYTRTEGNALYVTEIVRMLASNGGFAGTPASAFAIPDSVRLLIQHNLGHLSTPCRDLLAIASLCGREFRVATLIRASGLEPEAVAALLAEAEVAAVVKPIARDSGSLRFAHALIAEALAAGAGEPVRIAQHRRVAEALTSDPRADEYAAEIAYHWCETGPSGDPEQAVVWAGRAAERALASLAYEEAARLYQLALRALDWLPTASDPQRGQLLLGLGEAHKRSGDVAQAKESFSKCAALARELGSPELLTRAALGFAPQVTYAEGFESDASIVQLLEEAIRAWGGRDSGLHACALARLAVSTVLMDQDRKWELRDDAVAMARRIGDATTLRYVLSRWLDSLPTRRHDPRERLAAASEVVELAQAADDLELLAVGRLWRCISLLETGDADGMRREQAALSQIAAKLRQPVWSWHARQTEVLAALLDGRLTDAERLVNEALQIGQDAIPFAARGKHLAGMMVLRALQGQAGDFTVDFKAFLGAHPSPSTLAPLAWVQSERENADDTLRLVERAMAEDLAVVAAETYWLVVLSFLTECCAFLGDQARAARLYELLIPSSSQWVIWAEAFPRGPRAYFLGLLARTLRRFDEAAEHFEESLAICMRDSAPVHLAQSQYEYARMLSSRNAPGDAGRARGLLDQARETAKALGLGGLEAKIAALDRRDRAEPRSSARNLFRRDGDFWTIEFADREIRIKDMRGLHYLAQLLQHPGLEFHASDLAALHHGRADAAAPRDPDLSVMLGLGDAGEASDGRARAAYRARLADLTEQIEEAEGRNDLGTLARARAEQEALLLELSGTQRAGSHSERARVAVTKAIKAALDRISASHEALGAHLSATIRRGYFCSYVPDPRHPIEWES